MIAGRPRRWPPKRGQKTAASAGENSAARDLAWVEPEDFTTKVPRHQFPLGVVAGSLALVLRAGTHLKRVPEVLTLNWSWWAEGGAVGTYSSVRLWLLRLGLHQLNHPKEQADDWIWILDHTMQLGERKCLIIVGLRQAAWDAGDRCLRHEDVELIDLQPVTESTGEVVYRQMEAATAKTGVPRAIVSDDGRDLHRGIALFREAHPTTAWIYDIKHKTACLLKHDLENDASWQEFVGEVNRFKQRVSVTPLACLLPPQQRGKARYMSVDVLVDWAEKYLPLLHRPDVLVQIGLDAAIVEEKLGWLREYCPQIRRWREMLDVIETTEHYVRHQGIHRKAADELAVLLPKPKSEPARSLRRAVAGVRSGGGPTGPQGRTPLGLQRSARIDHRQVQMRGRRAGPAWPDGNGAQHRGVGRAGDGRCGPGRPDRGPNRRRLELVSNASWSNAAKLPPTDRASPRHGTKTETITPRQNLTFSPTHSRPIY